MIKLSLFALGLMLIFTNRTHAGEESLYDFLWLDPDKKVYVLQNKLYKKEHSVYFDAGYLTNFTSTFQDSDGFAFKGGYYFHEEWGVELFYNIYSNDNNDAYKTVRLVNEVDPFIRRPKSTYGVNLIWSPFYGKINTFNEIFYFDWSFGVGYGQASTQSNMKTVTSASAVSTFSTEIYDAGILKTKLKFHATENMHIGIEYMNTYYMAPGPQAPNSTKKKADRLRTTTDLIFSVGFSY